MRELTRAELITFANVET